MVSQSHNLKGPFLVDSHVHVYRCYPAGRFFDCAWSNIDGGAKALGYSEGAIGCLLFTETAQDDFFDALRNGTSTVEAGRWRLENTDESTALLARLGDTPALVLVAGRQIVTLEGLEVLALGTCERFSDGLTLDETIDAVRSADAIAVIPWGFGKWWFRRGRILGRYLRSVADKGVFLGDNGGRPGFLPRPPLFALASEKHFVVLPGSDPLPLPSEVARVGGYGFVLEGEIDRRWPAAGLKGLIKSLHRQPRTFGQLENLPRFLINQCRLRIG